MKLLLVHRYIRPDSPGYAHMLYLIGRRLAEAGHDVTIFSAQPSYNNAYQGPKLPGREQVDGMTVIRTPLFKESKKSTLMRSINFLVFSFSLLWHAIVRYQPYDVMTVSTFPPALMGTLARVIRFLRNTRYIYHCMDLYPEIAQKSGLIRKSWMMKLAAWIDRQNCERASEVVVLSEDMKDTVADRGVSNPNVTVLNNFIIDQVDPSFLLPESLQPQPDRFRILFAGNMGRFQSLETIMDAAIRLKDQSQIEFLFVGAGVMVEELKKQAGPLLGQTIHFHPYMPIHEVMSLIATSHLGVVSLTPGIIEAAYPSKTMSYLEAGCKLLAMVEPESELADLVEQEDIGVVVEDRSPELVAKMIELQFERWKVGDYDRDHVSKTGRKYFGQEVTLDRWCDLLERLR